MFQMIRSTASTIADRAKRKARAVGALLSTAFAITMASAPGMALASGGGNASTLGDAASAELDGAKTIIVGLLVTLVGIVFLFVVYSLIKKSK